MILLGGLYEGASAMNLDFTTAIITYHLGTSKAVWVVRGFVSETIFGER